MQSQSSPTRLIPLTQGLWALVDASDFWLLSQFRWQAVKIGKTHYASRWAAPRYMHRALLGLPPGRTIGVDHINLDGLDNRRSNLRYGTKSQNACNRGPQANNTSGYKGVARDPHGGWQAGIKLHGHRHALGTFASAEDAARAYDIAAIALHGAFARTNFQ